MEKYNIIIIKLNYKYNKIKIFELICWFDIAKLLLVKLVLQNILNIFEPKRKY